MRCRLSAGGYLLVTLIFVGKQLFSYTRLNFPTSISKPLVAQIQDNVACGSLNNAIAAFSGFTTLFNALLFFLRIFAVFSGQRIVIGSFLLLLVAVVVASLLSSLLSRSEQWIFGAGCTFSTTPNALDGLIASLVYDTLVFLFITVKLLLNTPSPGARFSAQVKAFRSGKGLGRITAVLLHSGQQYYLYAFDDAPDTNVLLTFVSSAAQP